MTTLSKLVHLSPFYRMRRHHALEHATLNVLARYAPQLRLAGYSDARGFWIVGNVCIDDLQRAVSEALARLQQGESQLAIHANCGTNYAVPGIIAGTAAWLAMQGSEKDKSFGDKLDRWSLVIFVVTASFLLFRPLGPLFQRKLTTDANVDGMQIIEITRSEGSKMVLHRILTTG